MTVAELIEKLKTANPNAAVSVSCDGVTGEANTVIESYTEVFITTG